MVATAVKLPQPGTVMSHRASFPPPVLFLEEFLDGKSGVFPDENRLLKSSTTQCHWSRTLAEFRPSKRERSSLLMGHCFTRWTFHWQWRNVQKRTNLMNYKTLLKEHMCGASWVAFCGSGQCVTWIASSGGFVKICSGVHRIYLALFV